MKNIAIVVALLLPISSGVWTGVAAASSVHVVSTGHATGRYAVANASGQINSPSKIQLVVSSKPELSGLVQWTVECRKGTSVIPAKRYKKTLKFPATIKVAFTGSSSLCAVAANVQLDGSGKVTISLETLG
jgi:hypothetical protein